MKINFKMSGGFAHLPALSKPFLVDTEKVDPQLAQQLESLVQGAHFFEQPAQVNTTRRGAADYQTYTISIEDSARSHTIQLTDPIQDPNLQQLVAQLRQMSRPSTEIKGP
jgi:hypothetical protein